MARFLATLAISFFLCLGFVTKAEAKFTCNELSDVEHSLSDLSDALKSSGSIKVGSKLDKDLDGLINHIFDMAKIEKNSSLTNAAKRMDSTWHDADWRGFRGALESVIKAVGALHDRDC